MSSPQIRVLFVCLGNICRSPLADGIFRDLIERAGLRDRFVVDSCGIGGWHVGESPDKRMIAMARGHGVNLSELRARRFATNDLNRFDEILAMDRSNLNGVNRHARGGERARVGLLLEEAPDLGLAEVPDPYYGGPEGFEESWRLVHAACTALLKRIRDERRL